ncbi:MAG: FAD-dependent oxidoreductase [Candidatus Hodarchaeota archaeon]
MMRVVGAVLVLGGGISGIRASLDLAGAGFKVYLVDRTPSIGGRMAQLDKTFPTLDCSICIQGPLMTDVARHPNIELLTYHELEGLSGSQGNFQVELRRKARKVDPEVCTACGDCFEACPITLTNIFDVNLGTRKAIYKPFPQAVPNTATVDSEHCVDCGLCTLACKINAINLKEKDRIISLSVGAIIVATGYDLSPAEQFKVHGFGTYPDVLTNLQFERLVCASGPTMGHLIRPSNGQEVESLAFVQCVGSRDIRYSPYCSQICCTAATKEAILAREHSPNAEVFVFYIDLRCFGKGFQNHVRQAEDRHVNYIRGKVVQTEEDPLSGKLVIRYEDTEKREQQEKLVDLVVLSVAMKASRGTSALAKILGIELNEHGFIHQVRPLETTRPGIYVAGAASGPKDIPDSVAEASGAAAFVSGILSEARHTLSKHKIVPLEKEIGDVPRVGVFICKCGANIGAVVDCDAVAEYASTLPDVAYSSSLLYACSKDNIAAIEDHIREYELNRVVVASCTPRTHEPLFRETCEAAGLNPYLFEMANIREHVSWVHSNFPKDATEKSKDLARMAVARARLLRPEHGHRAEIRQKAVVIGGGVSGLTAALRLAEQGYPVNLIEQAETLGGSMLQTHKVALDFQSADAVIKPLIKAVVEHPIIEKHLGSEIVDIQGFAGNYLTIIRNSQETTEEIKSGVIITAVGGTEFRPKGYFGYGNDPNIMTLSEFEKQLQSGFPPVSNIVILQCAHSLDEDHPYCSRTCCIEAVKNAVILKEQQPKAEIWILHRDLMTFGFYEDLLRKARSLGIRFVRYSPQSPPQPQYGESDLTGYGKRFQDFPDWDKDYQIVVNNILTGETLTLSPDKVVLSTPRIPPLGIEKLQRALTVPRSGDGFFMEAHPKLRPLDFSADGIYLCGECQGPKELELAIAQGAGAAGRAGALLSKEYLEIEAITSHVNPELCLGCGRCVKICTFQAISLISDPKTGMPKAFTNEAICKGCGLCDATCPNEAIQLRHFNRAQIISMIDALFEEEWGVGGT